MSKEKVIYNGVPVHPDWPAKMEESQRTTFYVVDGKKLPRIRYGDETDDWHAESGPCHDCAAIKGQYHAVAVCDVEECPACGGQVIGCDCNYEGDE